jgi:polysaccharide biosynthesis protein PslH
VRELYSAGNGPLRVLDEFNAEYLLQRRTALQALKATISKPQARSAAGAVYSLVQWRKLARYERRALRDCDGVFVVSHEDRAALARLDPWVRSFVVPNGVDCAYFKPFAATTTASTLVFTATMDYRPNVDAARWFVRDVLPQIKARHPEVQLRLVGRAPTAEVLALADDSLVTVTGEVADVRPEVARAAVYVVPMRIGGGVRLKLLEALAMQAPVVSTCLGAEGVEGLRDGEHCLLADGADAFARAVIRLLDDPALAQRLGKAGRRLVTQGYDWSAIVPRAEAAYAKLAD